MQGTGEWLRKGFEVRERVAGAWVRWVRLGSTKKMEVVENKWHS